MIDLRFGDCLEVLKTIPDKSIDLCVTDCPYKVVSGGRVGDKTPKGGIFSTFDSGFKTGEVFSNNNIRFEDWLQLLFPVMKDKSHTYIMVNGRNLSELEAKAKAAGFTYQNTLVWDKGNKTPNRYYMQQVEFILMLTKNGSKNITDMGQGNLISVRNFMGGKSHPTEKPVELLKILIENSSNSGDTVLDLFMGSGSTGEAAYSLSRKFIGIEVDSKYFEVAKDRLCL